ncbi:MAG: hypothetical protein H7276_21515 [Caulobacter sp.]|nr:hypothetical protein [Vitreoscilla sp.]
MTAFTPVATSLSSLGFRPTAAPATAYAPAAPTPAITAPVAGNQAVATTYDPTPVNAGTSGGGAISDAITSGLSGIARLVADSSNRVQGVQAQMQAMMTANGGQLTPVQLQNFQMQMSMAETSMQMAKNIQDKQDQINQIWARA